MYLKSHQQGDESLEILKLPLNEAVVPGQAIKIQLNLQAVLAM